MNFDTSAMLKEAFTYDADGNMTSAYHDGSRDSFRYDSTNRLIGTNTNTYTYNAENIRIRNLCGEHETTYVYNTNAKLSSMLMKTTDDVVTKYIYGRGLIGEETNGVFKTYHFDYRGSTVAITDINGNVTDTFEYDTYGRLTGRTGNSDVIFLYNGRDGVVTDSNGLIYMRARYYSPELRRFINADILAGRIDNAVTLNRYAYANGNPVSFVDPRGLSADSGRGNPLGNQDLVLLSSVGKYGPPNSITQWHTDNGSLMERWFGPDGRAIKDRHHTDHGNPKTHPINPHDHYWNWNDPNNSRLDKKQYQPSDSMTPPSDDDDDNPPSDNQPNNATDNPSENSTNSGAKESNTDWVVAAGGVLLVVGAGVAIVWVAANDVTVVGAADDAALPILIGAVAKGMQMVAT